MDIKEIKIKTSQELQYLLAELRTKLEDLRLKARQKQLKNVREVRFIKRDIARVMLALKEKAKTEKSSVAQ